MHKYIIQRDCLGIPMYIGNSLTKDNTQLSWYGNPAFAISFDGKTAAETFIKDVANCPTATAVVLSTATKLWEERCKTGHAGGSFLKLTPDTSKPVLLTGNKLKDRKALLHWWMKVYTLGSNVVQEVYSANSSSIYKVFNYLHTTGYWAETKQTNLCLILTRKDIDVAQMASEVNLALEYITPDKQGIRRFSVLEPGCSQFESYIIEEKDKNWKLQAERRHQTVLSSSNLTDFLTQVAAKFTSHCDCAD